MATHSIEVNALRQKLANVTPMMSDKTPQEVGTAKLLAEVPSSNQQLKKPHRKKKPRQQSPNQVNEKKTVIPPKFILAARTGSKPAKGPPPAPTKGPPPAPALAVINKANDSAPNDTEGVASHDHHWMILRSTSLNHCTRLTLLVNLKISINVNGITTEETTTEL